MRKLFLFFAATGAGLFSLFTPRDAHALGPLDIEIAGKAGYGTNPDSGLGFNPLGVGLGGRAGLSIFGLYAGVNVVDYLGGSQPAGDGDRSVPERLRTHPHVWRGIRLWIQD
jgi:hypothetical protein